MSLIEAARTGGSADVLRTLRTVCDARGLDGLAQRLADLGDLVAWDMRDVNEALETVPRGESLVHRSAHHLLERGGKRLRPMCVAVAARALTADRLDALRRRPPAEELDPAREVERSDEQAAGRRVHGLGCGLGYWGGVEKGAAAVE